MPKSRTADGAGFDVALAVRELRAADPRLSGTIDAVGPCRYQVRTTASMFGALSRAIVYQQLAGKAASTIHGRVSELFPRRVLTPAGILAASDEALRGAGLSRAKVAALRDLATKVTDREVPTLSQVRAMTDDEVVERLVAVRGIGRWTAEMLLMSHLGRPDVLPAGDYGVRKGFAIAFRKRDLPSPDELLKYGERWRPWRSIASWYMWRVCDLEAASRRKKES